MLNILANSAAARENSAAQQRPKGSSIIGVARGMGLDSTTPSRELAESERVAQFQRQIYRKWQPGDVYAPHDLSGTEQKKWKYGRKKPQQDAFDVLGINPVNEYKVRG
jgi:small subunit ribosomal protein S18